MSRGRRAYLQRVKDEEGRQGSAEASEEDPEETVESRSTRTSIDDITQDADVNDFGQTFLAEKESFQLGGEITSPAPFPLEVLPRMAYTINYQMVYDEERERWVPQKKTANGAVELVASETVVVNSGQRKFNNAVVDYEEVHPGTPLATVSVADPTTAQDSDIHSDTSPSSGIGYDLEYNANRQEYAITIENVDVSGAPELYTRIYRLDI